MARLLLVDDEKNIRNGLRAMISRADTIFAEVCECTNGADALKEIEKTGFDLVITDIRMPSMDGLELISKINSMENKPYVVVLSGYSDFKYAQEAIKYGARAYLLKPIDRNELTELLKMIEQELIRKSEEKQRLDSMTGELLESQLKQFFIKGNGPAEEPEGILRAFGIDIKLHGYGIAVISSCDAYNCGNKKENNSILADYIGRLYANPAENLFCCMDHNNNVVLISEGHVNFYALLDAVQKSYGYACKAGIGGVSEDASKMHLLYSRADEALRHTLFLSSRRIIHYNDICDLARESVLPVKLFKNLEDMLGTDHSSDIHKTFHLIFDEKEISRNHISYLEKLSGFLKNEMIRYLSEHIPQKSEFIREQENNFRSIFDFNNINDYFHHIYNCILNINDFLLMFRNIYNSSEIDNAIRFIHENYRKDLTMAEVANHISLNYSYFSILFKEKTGKNFIDYLKGIRIEKAKELLKDTDYKIVEISGMVGYTNPKHFATTFRMLTGITPREYKEKYPKGLKY